MENILEELNQIPGVLGSMIIGKDGLVVTTVWEQESDSDEIAAHTADIINTAESFLNEKAGYGSADMLTLEADSAKLFLKLIDESTFMAVAAAPKSNLGLIRVEIRATAEKLKEML